MHKSSKPAKALRGSSAKSSTGFFILEDSVPDPADLDTCAEETFFPFASAAEFNGSINESSEPAR